MFTLLSKVDKELLFRVKVTEKDECVSCIIWLKDYTKSKDEMLCILGQGELFAFFPFIGAVGVKIPQSKVFDFAKLGFIEYISTVTMATTMMQNTRKEIKVDCLHNLGYMGQGVTVAVIDTGCFPHIDMVLGKNRIKKFVNILGEDKIPIDDNGHGTFVCGVLAGNGIVQGGMYKGVAPLCDLVVIKALDKNGETQAFNVLSAMQWVYEHHIEYDIRVVCMSFGSVPLAKNDPLIMGAKALWNEGLVVVGAAGNDGPREGSIVSPGACPNIITVGAVHNTQDGYEMAKFSSRGPIYSEIKPDVVAPGVDIMSLGIGKTFYTKMSGTSVSTPIVAGVVALLLSKEPKLTPNQVKSILLNTAIRLPFKRTDCGMGLINACTIVEF